MGRISRLVDVSLIIMVGLVGYGAIRLYSAGYSELGIVFGVLAALISITSIIEHRARTKLVRELNKVRDSYERSALRQRAKKLTLVKGPKDG